MKFVSMERKLVTPSIRIRKVEPNSNVLDFLFKENVQNTVNDQDFYLN